MAGARLSQMHARLGQRFGQLGERVGIAARHNGPRRRIALRELRDEPGLQQRTLAGAGEAGEIEEAGVGPLQPAQGGVVGAVRAVEAGVVGFVVGPQAKGHRAAQAGLGNGDDLLSAPGLDCRHHDLADDDEQERGHGEPDHGPPEFGLGIRPQRGGGAGKRDEAGRDQPEALNQPLELLDDARGVACRNPARLRCHGVIQIVSAIATRLCLARAEAARPEPCRVWRLAHSPSRCSVMRRSRPRARCSNRKMPCQRPRSGCPPATGIDRCVAVSAARMCAGMSSEPSCVWV